MAITPVISQCPEDSEDADNGYYASTELEEEDIEELAEPWHRYDSTRNSRVFYPICIGEVLDHRYRIEHKLGHGGFSTVWMAHDIQSRTNVALKVMASGNLAEHEYRMQEVVRNIQDTPRLVTSLETFLLRGDKCDHRVLVFPLRGECLYDLSVKQKSMTTRMSAAKQLLKTLESLSEAGIVHRDLNEKNCMWGIASIDNLTRDAKYKALGRPLKQDIPYIEELWKKGEIVKPLKIPEDLRTETFYLGDFGLAMRVGDPMDQQGRPPIIYCSPDRLHNCDPSFACDIWSYMCIFAELYFGLVPSTTWADGEIVTTMIELFGPLPKHWKGHYVNPNGGHDRWYDQDYKQYSDNLGAFFTGVRPDADSIEREHVLSVMSRGFSCSPEKRLTATQLLQDPSFKAIINRYCH